MGSTVLVGYDKIQNSNNAFNMCMIYIDIDECSMSPNPCGQICTNNEGSFVCSCNNGYVLDDNQTSCNGQFVIK